MTPKNADCALSMVRNRLPEGAADNVFKTWALSHLLRMRDWMLDPEAPSCTAGDLLMASMVGAALADKGTVELRLRALTVEILTNLGVETPQDTVGALGMWSYFLHRETTSPEKPFMGTMLRREIKELARRLKDR